MDKKLLLLLYSLEYLNIGYHSILLYILLSRKTLKDIDFKEMLYVVFLGLLASFVAYVTVYKS